MRYRTAVPIGEGATAEVLKSWDEELGRTVALKLLRRGDAEAVERSLREARSLARVDHPHVPEVYEVGRLHGRPFIAMRWVDGVPLDRVEGLTLEQRVDLVATVAEAVHAAHRVGLVHRDLKPANLLVARGEAGELHPYVVDFGIARDLQNATLTATGEVLGTPGYMSPEQARGQIHDLDARSDIFSLGAVLFHLLAGQPPFHGASGAEALVLLLEGEAPPLRRVAPTVPRALEAVVGRCLAYRREDRYASARELAEDLRRWLHGESVRARRPNPLRRAGRWARRHPVATVATVLALLVVAAFAMITLRERWRAEERARLARIYGQEAERVESQIRLVRMAPAHDLAADRRRLASRLEELAARLPSAPLLERGALRVALGRGWLALDEPGRARDHLEAALALGEDDRQVSLWLGQALAQLYRDAREAVRGIADEELRRREERRAREQLLVPAVEALRSARREAVVEAPYLAPYIEGVLAFAEEDDAKALERARAAVAAVPWLVEGRLLEGAVHRGRALAALEANDLATVESEVAAALAAYAAAGRIASSDSRAPAGACAASASALEAGLLASNVGLEAIYQRGVERCRAAVQLDSQQADPRLRRAQLQRLWARVVLERGEDPETLHEAALEDGRRAAQLDLKDGAALRVQAQVWVDRADVLERRGEPLLETFDEARAALEEASRRQPGSLATAEALGRLLTRRANYTLRFHRDEAPQAFSEAEAVLRDVLVRAPSSALAVSLARVHIGRSQLFPLNSPDFQSEVAAGVEVARQAIATQPANADAWATLGILRGQDLVVADRLGSPGEDILAEVEEAFGRAIALRPAYDNAYYGLGRALTGHGSARLRRGEDPRAVLERATEALERCVDINPSYSWAYSVLATAQQHRARDARWRGAATEPFFLRQLELHRRTLDLNPGSRWAQNGLADAHFEETLARWQRSGRVDDGMLREAERWWREMAPQEQYLSPLQLARAELLRAQGAVADGADPEPWLRSAQAHLDEAETHGASDTLNLRPWSLRAELALRRFDGLGVDEIPGGAGIPRTEEGRDRRAAALVALAVAADALERSAADPTGVYRATAAELEAGLLRRRGNLEPTPEAAAALLDEALAAALRSVEINPRRPTARVEVARIHLQRHRLRPDARALVAARDALREALRRKPDFHQARRLLEPLIQGPKDG